MIKSQLIPLTAVNKYWYTVCILLYHVIVKQQSSATHAKAVWRCAHDSPFILLLHYSLLGGHSSETFKNCLF